MRFNFNFCFSDCAYPGGAALPTEGPAWLTENGGYWLTEDAGRWLTE